MVEIEMVEMVVVTVIIKKIAVIGITIKQVYLVFAEHLLCTSSYCSPFYVITHSTLTAMLKVWTKERVGEASRDEMKAVLTVKVVKGSKRFNVVP